MSDIKTQKLHIDSKRDKEIVPKSIKTKKLLNLSIKNVKQKKSRSMLVSAGMAIGMTAVMLILCLSAGLSKYVNKVYSESSQSLQMVVTKVADKTFNDTDISNLNNIEGIDSIIQTHTLTSQSYTYGESSNSIAKIQAYYINSFEPEMLYGSIKEDTSDSKYIIINETLASTLGDGNLIASVGNEISIKSNKFVISGVYNDVFGSENKANAFMSEDSIKTLTSSYTINTLYVQAKDAGYVSALKSDISSLGFSVYQPKTEVESVMEYIDLGTNILTAVGAISMVVSAIMIFIVLYISVNERMKEIGILRAIGARKKDIRKMFMFEAGIMGLIAGVLAVVSCFTISLITNLICQNTLKYALISYHIGYYLLGIGASVIISILAGISPAIRASDLDPVEALRAE